MKHIFLTLSLFILTTCIRADEGMWLPQFLKALNIEDMKRNGFKLTAEQLYSINRISMKDGVALFGGGCTAEVISKNGLLLTNHHCGYGAISALSTVDKNHLKQGFFAKSPADELPCKGLSVSFVKSIV
ncbi:MAG: S46 family peptidase, partial [Bacteroidia bacterium]